MKKIMEWLSNYGSYGSYVLSKWTLAITGVVAWAVFSLAWWDNNIDWTSFSEIVWTNKTSYEKCWDYNKNKCVESSPEFTFIWDQEVDIDMFDRSDIIWNNWNIKLIDNWHTVNIIDWAMSKTAVFWKDINKIFKDNDWKLVIENQNWEKKYYIIEKVKNWITNLKEYFKVTISIDWWKTFIDTDELDKITKTLDLWWREWEFIEIDNENWEVYKLYYNWKIIPLGFLNADTKEIFLDKEGMLIIKDKSINWKKWETTIFKLSKNLEGEILAEKVKREFVYKK